MCSSDLIWAVSLIKKIRSNSSNPDLGDLSYRQYFKPKINLFATGLKDLIFIEGLNYIAVVTNKQEFLNPITETPITAEIKTSELDQFLVNPLVSPDWPSHTQSCERAIRRVTEASKLVSTEKARDGIVLGQTLASKLMPSSETKSDFVSFVTAKAELKKFGT